MGRTRKDKRRKAGNLVKDQRQLLQPELGVSMSILRKKTSRSYAKRYRNGDGMRYWVKLILLNDLEELMPSCGK